MKGIVLFDGVCNVCEFSVQFIMKRDKGDYFRFASLQSEIGEKYLTEFKVDRTVDSIVFIEEHKVYTHSTAALKIAKHLDGSWKLLYFLIIVPKPIRDTVYKWIAKNRYRFFGKKDVCMLPTPEQRNRFL